MLYHDGGRQEGNTLKNTFANTHGSTALRYCWPRRGEDKLPAWRENSLQATQHAVTKGQRV